VTRNSPFLLPATEHAHFIDEPSISCQTHHRIYNRCKQYESAYPSKFDHFSTKLRVEALGLRALLKQQLLSIATHHNRFGRMRRRPKSCGWFAKHFSARRGDTGA
jgi:hypothetical protein